MLGLFGARADKRGLAIQTIEFARHMRPDRVLGIELGDLSPHPNDWSEWQQLLSAGIIGQLDIMTVQKLSDFHVRQFFDGLTSCYFAETDYDPQRPYKTPTFDIAREFDCFTLLDVNPELCRWGVTSPHLRKAGPKPDQFTVPTTWMAEQVPNARILPWPVNTSHFSPRTRTEVSRVLHQVGNYAMKDRAGTELVLPIPPAFPTIHFTIRAFNYPNMVTVHPNMHLDNSRLDDYHSLYDLFDLLLAPRRYGGRSLPLLEAMAAGLPVIALNREPERSYLPDFALIPARPRHRIMMMGGWVEVWEADVHECVRVLREITSDHEIVRGLSEHSQAVAVENSWEKLLPVWQAALAPSEKVTYL